VLDLNKTRIQSLIDFPDALQCISDAYIASSEGRVQTPDVMHLGFAAVNGDCHIKAGHIKGSDTFVVKIASGFYDNPKQGLSSSSGMILAFSATTGTPVAILRDEGWRCFIHLQNLWCIRRLLSIRSVHLQDIRLSHAVSRCFVVKLVPARCCINIDFMFKHKRTLIIDRSRCKHILTIGHSWSWF